MSAYEKYKIVFYLPSSGAECRMEYDNEQQYQAARAFLDARLRASPVSKEGEPVPRTVFYSIEAQQFAAFQEFMRSSAS